MALLFGAMWILLPGLAAQPCANDDPSLPLGIVPATTPFPGGDPLCGDLGSYRINAPANGATGLDLDNNGSIDLTIHIATGPCGAVLSWSSTGNVVLDQLVAKGGSDQNTYDYSGIAPLPSGDGNLHCPLNPNGKYADFSHIDFCFHHRLNVSKTALAEFTRSYTWSVDKSCNGPSMLTLDPGQVYDYPFSWSTDVLFTDSDWKVTGQVTVINNTPYDALIESITDQLSGGQLVLLNCGIVLPFVLEKGDTLQCTYSANLAAPANGTNTVTVETSSPLVEGGTATAAYAFGDPTTEVDGCILVTDDCIGTFQVCASDAYDKAYTCPISYPLCGMYTYTNSVSFVAQHTQATGSDACTVSVVVPCGGGCTLTIGYWKTHSKYGPAPYDDTWALVGEDTPFFLSGKSWYEAAWTSPAGNAYYILAHQYIAAQLNQLNGASIPPAVLTAFNEAGALFNTYTPAEIAVLNGNHPIRKQFVQLANILDDYNNGVTGPGHCQEQVNNSPVDRSSEDLELTGFQVYPNPAGDVLQLELSKFRSQSVRILLYNPLGALVLERCVDPVDTAMSNLRLEVGAVPNGCYNLVIMNGGERHSKVVVVNR